MEGAEEVTEHEVIAEEKKADIEVVSVLQFRDKLLSELKNGINTPIVDLERDSQMGVVTSSANEPKVVYESGAVPCAIIVVYNERGDISIAHEPMATNISQKGELSEPSLAVLRVLDATAIGYGSTARAMITGINVEENLREQTVKAIEENLTSYTRRIDKRFAATEEEVFDGVCVIPPQLSKDGRTKIIITARKRDQEPISAGDVLMPKKPGGGFAVSF